MADTENPADRYRELWLTGPPPAVEQFVAGLDPLSTVSLADILRADQIERWERGKGFPAEWYLNTFPALAEDAESCLLLIYGELLSRTGKGEAPALEEFTARFPQFTELLALQWEVHHAFEAAAVTETIDAAAPRAGPADYAPCVVVPGYDVECEVGRGAVAVVYRAKQLPLNRTVALKVVLEGQLARPEKLVRFLDEARVIARLKHPNIVGIYDLGKHDVGPFMALEWVDGGTLAAKIKGGPLDPIRAATILATVARAVGHAHQSGVIHRDLKPANILLTLAGEPKVADFGLAKHLDLGSGATASGLPVGTPQYMAPEQTRGTRNVSTASDVYALGVTLFECITGRAPLVGTTVPDTLRLVAEQEPPNPRTLNAAVPRDLSTICLKCLEKEPLRRYKTGHELADDLDAFLAGLPVSARPIGSPEKLWRWARKHRSKAVMIAIVIGLFAASAIGAVLAAVFLDIARVRAELAERETRDRVAGLDQARWDAKDKLWRSLVNEARGLRRSGRPGQRVDALAKLSEARGLATELAAAGRPVSADDLGLMRDEAAAALALPDVTPTATAGPFEPGWTPQATSADGSLVAVENLAGDVAVHRVPDGAVVAALPPAGAPVPHPVTFSPDGRYLVRTAAANGRLRHQLWDVAGPTKKYDGESPPGSTRPVFAMGSARLAVPTFNAVAIVRTDTGATAAVLPVVAVGGMSFDPAGDRLAAVAAGEFVVADSDGGRILHRWPAAGGAVLGWHPEGKTVAVRIGRDVLLADALSGRPVRDLLPVFAEPGGTFAFAPGGRYAVAADPAGLVRVWDIAAGRELFSAPARVHALAVGPGGVIGFEIADRRAVVLKLDLPTGYRTFDAAFPRKDGHYVTDPRVSVAPAGDWLAVPSQDGVRLLDLRTGADVGALPDDPGPRFPVRFTRSSGGSLGLITAGAGGIVRWPISAGTVVRVGPPERLHPAETRETIDATPDGTVVAVPEPGRHAVMFRPAGPGQPVRTEPHPGLKGCGVSPDGKWVLTGGGDWDSVILSDAETGHRLRVLAPEGGTGVFGPDGTRLAVRRAGGGGQVWKLAEGAWVPGPALPGGAFAFAPDGRLIAVQVGYGEVHLIDSDSGRTVAKLEAPHLTRLAPGGFSPDGATFVAAGLDSRAVHVWNLRELRAELAKRGTDWNWPTLPPEATGPPAPKHVQMTLGTEARRRGVEAYRAFQRFEYRKAAELCKHVLATDPADATARHVLALVKIRGGNTLYDPVGATAVIDALVVEHPNVPSYRLTRGVVRFHRGRFSDAAADLATGTGEIQGGPGPYYWGYLAAARALAGDVTGARAALKSTVSGILIGDADWRRWLPAGK